MKHAALPEGEIVDLYLRGDYEADLELKDELQWRLYNRMYLPHALVKWLAPNLERWRKVAPVLEADAAILREAYWEFDGFDDLVLEEWPQEFTRNLADAVGRLKVRRAHDRTAQASDRRARSLFTAANFRVQRNRGNTFEQALAQFESTGSSASKTKRALRQWSKTLDAFEELDGTLTEDLALDDAELMAEVLDLLGHLLDPVWIDRERLICGGQADDLSEEIASGEFPLLQRRIHGSVPEGVLAERLRFYREVMSNTSGW